MAFFNKDTDPNIVRPTDDSQEDLDFTYLFLYSSPDDEFASVDDSENSNSSLLPQLYEDSCNYPPEPNQLLYTHSSDSDLHPESGAGLDHLELLVTRLGAAPSPSPRIEITLPGESLQSLPLHSSPSSRALAAYREQQCPSPGSSNSSTSWLAETNSPWASPCISPSGGGMGQLMQDLCPGLQGMHTSSSHSSPGTSPRNNVMEEPFLLQRSQQSPSHSPSRSPHPHSISHLRSRSTSPQGKRTYDQYSGSPSLGTPVHQRSRSPSPGRAPQHCLQGPLHHQPQAQFQSQAQASSPSLEEVLSNLSSSALLSRVVPSKIVRPSEESCVWGQAHTQGNLFGEAPTQGSPYGHSGSQDRLYADTKGWVCEQERRGRSGSGPGSGSVPGPEPGRGPVSGSGSGPGSGSGSGPGPGPGSEILYVLPPIWSAPLVHHGVLSVPPGSSVPPLEWPVPSLSGEYQLQILQQPKPHHRAHYETEGSRGPVKAPGGGYPEVQLRGYRGSAPLGLLVFIGTADERVLRPHAFYQVHRITGKTVTTPSLERSIHGTKVLELALEPSNNMKAVIDCAGILKLKNADIEVRNGETDVGRKNTRVCLVFRVHIPEPGGHLVSLQVATLPIECSQRPAQEHPMVENQDVECCSVLGGQKMILVGQNFTSESRVVFSEKTHEDVQIWEAEASVDRGKSQNNILFVEVPPYRDLVIHQAVRVNFCVINGRRKCSQFQHFTYAPLTAVKTEPVENYQYSLLGCAVSQTSRQSVPPGCYTQSTQLSSSPYNMPGMAPYQQPSLVPSSGASFSQHQPQYKLPSAYHLTSISQGHHPPGPGAVLSSGGPAHTPLIRPQQGQQQPSWAPQQGPQSQILYSSHRADHLQTSLGDEGYLATSGPMGAFPVASSGPSGQMYQGYVQVQTVLPLSRSPPGHTEDLVHRDPGPRIRSRLDQGGQSADQRGPVTSYLPGMIAGKIQVKQENLNQNYLDDAVA